MCLICQVRRGRASGSRIQTAKVETSTSGDSTTRPPGKAQPSAKGYWCYCNPYPHTRTPGTTAQAPVRRESKAGFS